ncbi:unnamed protein product [Brachionus calyciflorus]|uniref:Uncharacterized protein n=1 Tax=Brachionus calyciflorus TaxID=104777 RepID=A0A814JV09_9BILA|nr:unnamed protein product [Brachionus calyciflorus]
MTDPRNTSRGRPARQPLEVPATLRANQTPLRTNQNIGNSQNQRTSDIDELAKGLDRVLSSLTELNDGFTSLRETVAGLTRQNLNLNTNVENIDQRLNQIGERLERIERQMVPANGGFSEQMIIDARDQLGLDLNRPLMHNGHHLTNIPFNQANVNLFGTRLMDILFTREEQSRGSVEPARRDAPALDQDRIDLIKICYLKKLRSIENFLEIWPSVVRSLRQKSLDAKRRLRVNGLNGGETSEDEFVQPAPLPDNLDDDLNRAPIRRDVTMGSLNSL